MTSRPTRKRLWRKRLTRAPICLLLGAATTVGVAWGCAAWSPPASEPEATQWSRPWPAPRPAEWPAEADQVDVTRYAFGGHSSFAVGTSDDAILTQYSAITGWPRPALGWHLTITESADFLEQTVATAGSTSGSTSSGTRSGLPMPRWLARDNSMRYLPVRPLRSGFLLDTLFYAALWWVTLVTPGALNRWRRRRRGRCVGCGYDVGRLPTDDNTTPTCPECGA